MIGNYTIGEVLQANEIGFIFECGNGEVVVCSEWNDEWYHDPREELARDQAEKILTK